MKKINVYLDMDGTIADLYHSTNWLDKLENEEIGAFDSLKPLTTEEELFKIFPKEKYDIKILSMTPKGASREYCETVKQEKDIWLDKFFPSLTKRIYIKYGSNKNLKNSKNAILVDDNKTIRNTWKGKAINPITLWGIV